MWTDHSRSYSSPMVEDVVCLIPPRQGPRCLTLKVAWDVSRQPRAALTLAPSERASIPDALMG